MIDGSCVQSWMRQGYSASKFHQVLSISISILFIARI